MKAIFRAFVLLLGLFALVTASPAAAAERSDYTQAKFDAAAQAGKPILLEIWAAWCPVCRAQDPVIKSLMTDPAFKDLTILSIDFDKEKDLLRRLNVQKQSTLIAFKGAAEQARSTGDTSTDGIRGLVKKAL